MRNMWRIILPAMAGGFLVMAVSDTFTEQQVTATSLRTTFPPDTSQNSAAVSALSTAMKIRFCAVLPAVRGQTRHPRSTSGELRQ